MNRFLLNGINFTCPLSHIWSLTASATSSHIFYSPGLQGSFITLISSQLWAQNDTDKNAELPQQQATPLDGSSSSTHHLCQSQLKHQLILASRAHHWGSLKAAKGNKSGRVSINTINIFKSYSLKQTKKKHKKPNLTLHRAQYCLFPFLLS